jgi:cytochrome c oxidase subunit 4
MSSQHGHHIIPKKTLYKVFGALAFLTVLTGLTAEYVDLGSLNVPLALAIAVSKATLVATFFMALKYDNRVNTLVFMVGILFVGVFLVFTLFDTVFRGDLGNVGSETISEIERLESTMLEGEAAARSDSAAAQMPGMEEDGAAVDSLDIDAQAEDNDATAPNMTPAPDTTSATGSAGSGASSTAP